ncbi:signal peptidase I [Pseudoalteromonas tunicata]|uniref:signal peptidase I n=1 Tax=Pseudoalteromonas tunicata TaxID=314281 RepID=UPI0003269A0F|nr:signal peptidase I [Pseudoalteromonas tunicata]ATC95798.1 hypothetical protein PTUN_a3478 [Pseudoalteromonas tunicata]AXT31344.1 signal peptidase I [Pseudoalteromonas tunicata]
MKNILCKVLIILIYLYSIRLFELGSNLYSFPYIFHGFAILFVIFFITDLIRIKKRNALLSSVSISIITVSILSINLPLVTGYSFDKSETKSNWPTISSNDYIISKHFDFSLDKGAMYGFKNAQGDLYRKRLIAGPNDRVQVCGDLVYVNGFTRNITTNWKAQELNTYKDCSNGSTYRLKEDQYFFVGDNFTNSHDSRHYGPVKRKDIVAHSLYKFQLNQDDSISKEQTSLSVIFE